MFIQHFLYTRSRSFLSSSSLFLLLYFFQQHQHRCRHSHRCRCEVANYSCYAKLFSCNKFPVKKQFIKATSSLTSENLIYQEFLLRIAHQSFFSNLQYFFFYISVISSLFVRVSFKLLRISIEIGSGIFLCSLFISIK